MNIRTVLEGLDIEDHPGRRAGDRIDLPGRADDRIHRADSDWVEFIRLVGRAGLVERILGMADGYSFGQ